MVSRQKKQVNIPNLLTMIRIWIIPVIVFLFFFDGLWASITAVVLFVLAGITDYLDGYLARSLKQTSSFGRVLDPIADKLLVGAIIVMLAYSNKLPGILIIPAVVIMCREILVSGLREFLAEIQVGLPVTRLAKWKTACQMVALPMLMLSGCGDVPCWMLFFHVLGSIFLWGAGILTVITGYDYLKSGMKYLK